MVRGATSDIIGLQLFGGSGPFDLTLFSVQAQVRVEPAERVILDLLPQISDATNGMIEIPSFTAEQTSALPLGVYHWDLILIDVLNEPFPPFLVGQYYIVDKITDS